MARTSSTSSHKTSSSAASSTHSSISSTSSSSTLSQYPYGKAGENLDFTPTYPYVPPTSTAIPSSVRAIYSKDGRGHQQSFYSTSYPYASEKRNTSSEALTAGHSSTMSQYPYGKAGQAIDFSASYRAKGY